MIWFPLVLSYGAHCYDEFVRQIKDAWNAVMVDLSFT